MRFLWVLCVLAGFIAPALALDREAFTFTNYDLRVRIEPEQQRIGVRGKMVLRNDSSSAQKNLVLQVSSTLDWRSIQLGGRPIEFIGHEYVSDIDHSGSLSEAIVTLPKEVAPGGLIELEVGYEGVIPLDGTRLTQIGVPEDKARHSDWDQISKAFTAVRGIGYVAWYPIATEAAGLSEGNSLAETVARWQAKQADTTMALAFESTGNIPVLFSRSPEPSAGTHDAGVNAVTRIRTQPGISVPTFVLANYQTLQEGNVTIHYFPGQEEAAKDYAEIATQIDPIVPTGQGNGGLQIVGLPDPDAAPFVTEGMLLTPLKSPMTNEAELSMVYAKARQLVISSRPWIQDGLAHYAQAAFVEAQKGREAALDYLKAHRDKLTESEKQSKSATHAPGNAALHSLINSPDDLYLQTKAMYVWWMLKDMLGNLPTDALLNYRAEEDKDGAYMQRLIEKQTHRDLQWFFDDWVYRDRGLPDFRVDSVYPRAVVGDGYIVTVTVEDLGDAGAEVPVMLRMSTGDYLTRRLEVRAKSKASVRIEAPAMPLEVIVNDGSVPESDMSNNQYKVEAPTQ